MCCMACSWNVKIIVIEDAIYMSDTGRLSLLSFSSLNASEKCLSCLLIKHTVPVILNYPDMIWSINVKH